MIRKVVLYLLLLVILSFVMPGFSASITIDKQSIYDKGLRYIDLKDYNNALTQFQQIDNYQDSASWRYYCEGMKAIITANEKQNQAYLSDARKEIEKAAGIFQMLSLAKFEDTEKLAVYCKACQYELQGLYQSAIDLYVGLFGTLDSDIRYFKLIGGYVLPTQAPTEKPLPPIIPSIPAHTDRTLETFLGPGSGYMKQDVVSLNAESTVAICAREGDYYLIEITTGEGKIRCWAFSLRVQRYGDVLEPELGKTKRTGYVMKTETGLYGPGDGYRASDIMIPSGTRVTVFNNEGMYTMVEFVTNNQPARMWVPTESIVSFN